MTSALETLRRDSDVDIVEPGAADYEAAGRTVFASGRPACVLRPHGVRGVQAAVRFATRAGLVLSVRGGGHGLAGFGTNDDGVVIDLCHLATVQVVDAARHRVRIGGGATWGQVADGLAPHGLAISAGDTTSVGVGGLTLGGGIGWKVRKYGLALDQLVAAEVVVADGTVVRASAQEHPELFWALRGGGGNFGIVTAFEFAAHPTTDVFHGTITFPASAATAVVQGWANYLRAAPDELTSVVTLANPAAGGPDAPVAISVVFDGDAPELAAAALAPIRRLGPVITDDVALTSYADTLEVGATPPPGIRFVARSAFVEQDSVPTVLRILAASAASTGSPVISLRSVSGAAARVADDATAYAHRRAELMFVTLTAGPAPMVEAAVPMFDLLWTKLAAHVDGAYANFLTSATDADVAAIYPAKTLRRLAILKRRYDPGNVFAGNHNIAPLPSRSDGAPDARVAKRRTRTGAPRARTDAASATRTLRRSRTVTS